MPTFTGWDIVRRPVVDGLAGAIAVAHQLPSTVAGPFHAAARDAFSTGMDIVAVVGAGILLVGGVTTTSLLRAGRGGQDVVVSSIANQGATIVVQDVDFPSGEHLRGRSGRTGATT